MLAHLTATVVKDLMIVVGLGLAGNIASQIKYHVQKGGK